MTDPSRASFVRQAFRYEVATDPGIKSAYPNATEIVQDTYLDADEANDYATDYHSLVADPQLAFTIQLEAAFGLNDLIGSPPRFTCDFPEFDTDGRTFKTSTIEIDHMNNRTKVVARG